MGKLYKVNCPDSFYHEMTGKLIEEFPKTYLLEFFRESNPLGGVQKVMFYKYQIILIEDY